MKIRLHVQRWTGSAATEEGEDATALLNGVLELDGQLITNGKVTVESGGGEIFTVTAELIASSFQIVEHSRDSWVELDAP